MFLLTKFLDIIRLKKKLNNKYAGPFEIIKIINNVAFRLKLPEE